MLACEVAGKNGLLLETGNLGVLWILWIKLSCTYKLLRCLDVVWCLVEKQPAAQVVETMTFESKLYGTLAANLIHELVLVAGKLGSYIGYTGTFANLVHCIESSE